MKSLFWKNLFFSLFSGLFLFSANLGAADNLPTDSSFSSWTTLWETDAYFWSGIKFGQKIFGGTHNGFQIISYPPDAIFKSKGETAFSFCEFQGKLYLTNESREIWRLEETGWKKLTGPVSDESTHYFDLTVFDKHLYLKAYNWWTNTSFFYKSADGEHWEQVYLTDKLENISFVYKGALHSAGKDKVEFYWNDAPAVGSIFDKGTQAWRNVEAFRTDYNSWYMFGYEDPGTGKLFLGSGAFYPASYEAGIVAELHRFDGDRRTVVLRDPQLFRFSSMVRAGEKLYVLGDSGYEARSGLSRLYESLDGDNWRLTRQFDFPCANAVVDYDGAIVVFGGREGDGIQKSYGLITALAGTPAAVTGAATEVTSFTAALNGSVKPNGANTAYHFEWGLTKDYGNSTVSQTADRGFGYVPVFSKLSGLMVGTRYHYRLVAASRAGTAFGADMTFTTRPGPPAEDPSIFPPGPMIH